LQRAAEHLHRLGARAIHELLLELTTEFGPAVFERAEAYRRIDPNILRALGADRFPPALVAIDGGAR
jgi:hypothetical protein